MKYPNFLKDNGCIGLLATSCGNNKNPYRLRTQVGILKFQDKGYILKKGHRLFRNKDCVSGPHELRGRDFMNMYKNKNIDFLWSTGGGELMMGMLPYVDFEKIKKLPPKFFMGFSDNTNLTFTLTTICDVATIYASSIGKFAIEGVIMEEEDNYKLMTGQKLKFHNYDFYDGPLSHLDDSYEQKPLENREYKDPVEWKSVFNNNEKFNGRLIGGCIDILICLCGTKYDKVASFIEKYKEDGIIWYFDPCDLNSAGLYRAFFQLKEAGWLKYVKGFLVGRPASSYEVMGYTFEKAIMDALKEFNVPILYDVDITHKSPTIPIINGACCNVEYSNGKASLEYILK